MGSDIPDLDLPGPAKPAGQDDLGSAPQSGPSFGSRPGAGAGTPPAKIELEDDGPALNVDLDTGPVSGPRQRPGGDVAGYDDVFEPGAGGQQLEADDDDGQLFETHDIPAPSGAVQGVAAPSVGLAGASAMGKPPASGAQGRAGPPTSAQLQQDIATTAEQQQLDSEAAALARYGPTPSAIWMTPQYAIRVFMRRRELAVEETERKSKVDEAFAMRGEAFVQLVDRQRATQPADHPFAKMAAPLTRFDDATAATQAAVAAANDRLHQEIAEIDAGISAVDEQIKQAQTDLAAAEQAVQAHLDTFDRAAALVKRADIELRAANEAARVAAGPNAKFAPPEHAKKIQQLQAQKTQREQEFQPVRAQHDQLEQAVATKQAALRHFKKQLAALGTKRSQAHRAGAAVVASQSAVSAKAELERHSAYAEVGQAMLESQPALIGPAEKAAVDAADEAYAKAARDLAVLRRALLAADPNAVKQGQIVLGVAAGLVLLLLVGIIVAAS